MISITKRGLIYLKTNDYEKIICNRPGIVAEVVYDWENAVGVSEAIRNPYTISYATEGTPLSFFSIRKKGLSEDTLNMAWFMDFDRAYFLVSLTRIDGYLSHWTYDKPFGELILKRLKEESFQKLDRDYAYTFLLQNSGLKIVCIWDIECQQFIPPTSKLWKTPEFCKPLNFIVKRGGIQEELSEEQKMHPLTNIGVELYVGKPLLVTIYCKDTIYLIRVMTRSDMYVNRIRNRAVDKYEALLIARFEDEDTSDYEERYFTKHEIETFNSKLEKGFKTFKDEIYRKSVLNNWIRFPDKIYNTIRLGDILNKKGTSYVEKQNQACEAIKGCTRGWEVKALFEFYKEYVQ